MSPERVKELLAQANDEEKAELDLLLTENVPLWEPLAGPQLQAWNCEADYLFYGGQAGGGKTDLLCGLGVEKHIKSIIFRKEGPQLQGIYDRLTEIIGNRDGFSKMDKIWRIPGKQLEFGAVTNPGDELKYQGRPHDLKGFDEICHFKEAVFRFLCGWLRSTDPNVRQRVVCTGNPPTDAEGEWVKRFWAPWLDPDHHKPAEPGELRWYTMIDGVETECPDGEPFDHNGETLQPKSRTFIPSSITDNPYLMNTGYMATLQALPEPLRSQLLYGDFNANTEDDAWQVIPTAWVKEAQARWVAKSPKGPMDSIGADIACGGKDNTVISRRHGTWFDELQRYPGVETPDGAASSALIIAARRDNAPVHMDIIGWGKDTHTHLTENQIHTIGVNGANKTEERTQKPKGYHGPDEHNGTLGFVNMRALLYWRMREELDPKNDTGICLPPDPRLRAQLCAHRWKLAARGVQILSKDEVKELLGESPDDSDAIVMANMKTVKFQQEHHTPHIMQNDFDVFES